MSRSFSLMVFTVVFAAAYILSFANGWTVFRYYPLSGEFSTLDLPVAAGPAMGWYSWIVQGFAIAAAAAFVALLVPQRLGDRIWPNCAWVATLAVLAYTIYVELHWFQNG